MLIAFSTANAPDDVRAAHEKNKAPTQRKVIYRDNYNLLFLIMIGSSDQPAGPSGATLTRPQDTRARGEATRRTGEQPQPEEQPL